MIFQLEGDPQGVGEEEPHSACPLGFPPTVNQPSDKHPPSCLSLDPGSVLPVMSRSRLRQETSRLSSAEFVRVERAAWRQRLGFSASSKLNHLFETGYSVPDSATAL